MSLKLTGTATPALLKTLCAFIIALTAITASGQMRQAYLDLNENNEIRKLSFVSPTTGYAGFRDWVGYTTDSGKTFTKKYISYGNVNFNGYTKVNLTFGFYIAGVHAINQNTIIVYGDYGACPSILYSTDQGNTYTLIYQTPLNINLSFWDRVTDMVFPGNGSVGYAVTGDRIIKSTNGGQSWSPVIITPNAEWKGIDATDVNNVYAYSFESSNYHMLKTANAGAAWSAVTLPVTGGVRAAHFLTTAKGWVSVADNDGSKLYYTSNGGANWTRKDLAGFYFDKVRFINDSTGYAIGDFFNTYKTTDSGKIWERLPRNNQYEYLGYHHNDIHFWNNNQFWAGGGHGFLELTTNGGGLPYPKAHFKIDTTGLSATNVVNLLNQSKTTHQFKWFKNGVLFSSNYHASYTHNINQAIDTIMLVALNATGTDTAVQYQYFNLPPPPPVPTLTSFSPNTGYPGTVVTINGTNLNGTTAVSFGGVPASSYTVVSPTKITAVVGTGASGSVTITTPYGTASLAGFTFQTQMRITSFVPASGPAGSSVVITGANFSPVAANNLVRFGSLAATVTAASATQLTVTVPAGAMYAPISVTVNGATAYSTLPYVLTFAGGGPITSSIYPDKIKFFADQLPNKLETADIDGDGKLDIVTGALVQLRLSVFRNTSTGDAVSFAAPVFSAYAGVNQFSERTGPFTIADMNGDGKPDLVTANHPIAGVTVMLNNSTPGNINLTNTSLAPSGLGKIYDIAAADFDGDGKPDIYTNSDGGLRVLKNTGSGSTVSFTMLAALNLQGTNLSKAKLTDIDGDGKIDICINSLKSGVRTLIVYQNTSNGNTISFSPLYFTSSLACEDKLYIGDVDMDGKPDVLMIDPAANKLGVMRNTSTGGTLSFAASQTFAVPAGASALKMADINGDAKPDIGLSVLIQSQTSAPDTELSVLENTSGPGSISFTPRADILIDNTYGGSDIALGDWNNDNKPDAATVRDSLVVFTNRTGIYVLQICDGADSSLTANLTGATYQWQEDSGGGFVNISDNSNFSGTNTNKLYLNDIPAAWNGRKYRCIVDGVSSYLYQVRVKTFIVPQVTINQPTALCQPTPYGFSATVVNGGERPVYRWQLNGINIVHGANVTNDNDSLIVFQPRDGDILRVTVTSNAACISGTGTDVMTLKVYQYTTPAVMLSSTHSSVCNGQPVTFTATPVNGGTQPHYAWFDNGNPIFLNDTNVYVSTNPNAHIRVQMTTSLGCYQGPRSVNSNIIQLSPTPLNPVLSVTAMQTGACAGEPVAYVAYSTNGGNSPTYQWQVNGVNVGTNSNVYMRTTPGTDQVRVILTSNSACTPTTTVTSSPITVPIATQIVPTISITTTGNTCQGGAMTFNAAVTNSGQYPSYQWQVNGVNVGTNSLTYTAASLTAGDQVRAVMFSSEYCGTPGMVYSNVITIGSGNTSPSISITTPNTNVCAGASVVFTATTTNAGTNAVYQWKKNGVNVGTNSNTYTENALVNGDVITAAFTSNTGCTGGNPVTVNSNAINMNVAASVMPSVSIAASNTTICPSQNVTFTATPVNGGNAPSYQWQVNGVNAGTNSNSFSTTSLTNGNQVKVQMTSNAACALPATTTSNSILIAVTSVATPAITISTPATTACAGSNITFTAAVSNPGTNPVYQWKKNGVNVGTNSNTYTTNTLATGDVITASLSSNLPCNSAAVVVNSNAVSMTMSANLTPSVTVVASASAICQGQSIAFTATPVNGGSSPAYQWQVNGTNAGINSNTFTTNNLSNNNTVRVILTSNASCLTASTANSNDVTVAVTSSVTPAITISGNTSVITGNSTQLSTNVTNGGNNPLFQWQDSTFAHGWQNLPGATSSTLVYAPAQNGDKVRCTLTSNANCISASTVTSAALTFQVLPDGRVANGPFGVLYYPNPAVSVLTLDSLRLEDKWETVEITTLSGESKMSVRNVQNQTKITLYIGGLPSGIYMAVLRRKSGAPGYYKFIKR